MCCGEFIAKYLLFFVNLLFSLGGLCLVGLGIAALVQATDLLELIPVNLNLIPISVIVVGCIIFFICFLGCCGAIRESRCMLIMYAICMIILAALKIWLAVIVFNSLSDIRNLVEGWLNTAFGNTGLAGAFHTMEEAFRCCGTTGAESYPPRPVPPSCCAEPVGNTCLESTTFQGCNDMIGGYFETFGDAIAAVLIVVIVVELVAMLLAFFLNGRISDKSKNYRV